MKSSELAARGVTDWGCADLRYCVSCPRASQMSAVSESSRAAAETKRPAVPASLRLSAVADALPDVPKPIAQIIDQYAARPPPSELILELSHAISHNLIAEFGDGSAPHCVMGRVRVHPFHGSEQLRGTLSSLMEWQQNIKT